MDKKKFDTLKLLKILPKGLVRILSKYKYFRENLDSHNFNLNNGHVIYLHFHNQQTRLCLHEFLTKAYYGTIRLGSKKLYFHPIAAIQVPTDVNSYLKAIGAKSRNMIKKAEKKIIPPLTLNGILTFLIFIQ